MAHERTVLVLLLAPALIALACGNGGGGAKAPAKAAPADAGSDARASVLTTSPPPSGLPPMATMPPPGVVGSKKAKLRSDAALATCSAAAKARAKDPTDLLKRIGEACANASASKMKPLGAVLRGQQSDKDAHQEHRFRADANHCYRLYFASDDAVKDVVIVLRDSAGDVVSEAAGPAVPEQGAACFTTADEVSILVGVGNGKGAWAAQVWGD